MNPFDILVVIIVGYGLVRGLFRGLVKEVASIIGVLGGFYLAYSYYRNLGTHLGWMTSNESYQMIIGFLVIFCGVLILVAGLAMMIKYLLKIAYLGWADRIGGLIFGGIKGILIISILFLMLTAFLPKDAGLMKNSVLAPHISMVSEKLAKVVSTEMKDNFTTRLKDLKKAWKILN
jgi:membrane protein required for colicin V production